VRSRMFLRRALSLAGAGALAVAGMAAAVPFPAAAAPPAVRAITLMARGGTGGPPAHSAPVLLITGTRVAVVAGPGGRPATVVLPSSRSAAGLGAAILTTRLAGHLSEVPADALPFVGHGLDPSLFDLAALRRLEHEGRLPVRVSYQGRVPRLPGVTITHAAAKTAAGFVTARSAAKFGAALSHQFTADHDRAAYGTDGLFARGVSIALAGAASPSRARPRFVMHTLTVHGTNLAGRADNGDSVFLISADNTLRIAGAGTFRHGVARLSTPAGRYWAVGLLITPHKAGFVFPHQFTIPARGRNPRVTIAGQSVRSELSVATPRPAVRDMLSFTFIVRGHAGPPAGLSLSVLGGLARQLNLAVAPARLKPTRGSLRTFTQEQLVSPAGTGVPYVYNLDFPGALNRIPRQRFTVRQSSLATVRDNYFQDLPSAGDWVTIGGSVPELEGGPAEFPNPLRLPGRQVQYMTGNPSMLWLSRYIQFSDTLAGGQAGSLRSLRAGQQVTDDWGRYPLHPAPDQNLARRAGAIAGFSVLPSAARAGDALALGITPFSDSTPGHLAGGFAPDPHAKITERYQVDQDGVRLASGDASTGIAPVRLSAHPSMVRFTLSAKRTGAHYLLSPASTTTWTWRSRRDAAATVPAPWACRTGRSVTAGLTRHCLVQPMMTLAYQVAGLSLAGTTAPGGQAIGLTASHLQLARGAAITAATLRVSFDGGKTWRPATVTALGDGRFRAAFTAPAGAFVTLRVTAADAAGGSVTETISRAYQTTS